MLFYSAHIKHSFIIVTLAAVAIQGFVHRCWKCRSRGTLGDCKDTFRYNETTVAEIRAVEPTPCASGWCGKIIEGEQDDYGLATERMCLQRPPNDLEERCSETKWQRRKVFMCMCKGDLCNEARKLSGARLLSILAAFSLLTFLM
ncbi:Uncharacterised protein g1421 [Pycnogonum litorale]